MAGREKVELFEAADGWRFRKRAANGEITLTGEAYARRESAEKAVRREFPDLEMVVIPDAPPVVPPEQPGATSSS
jgi:uncharacterized protein YegP (UPF0339 family)